MSTSNTAALLDLRIHLFGTDEADLPTVEVEAGVADGHILHIGVEFGSWHRHLTLAGESTQVVAFLRRMLDAAEAAVAVAAAEVAS